MLQNIRDNAQGIVSKVIIGFIVVSFSIFGLDSLVGGSNSKNVAVINGEELSATALNQAISVQRNRLISAMGDNVDPARLDEALLRDSALKQLVQKQLLLQAASDSGIAISEKVIDQLIVAMPQFQENGQFSTQLYQSVLRSNGYSMAMFKTLMADDLAISQVTTGIAGSDFVTQRELEQTAKIVGQKRSFQYFKMPITDVAAAISIEKPLIESYYQENIDDFQTEDQVKLAFIEIKQEDFVKPVNVEQLKEAYEIEMAGFEADEERRASHILIEINDSRNQSEAEQLARDILARITAGEPFATLAEMLSEDAGSASNAGDLGYTNGDTFPHEFEQALFALELNAVSAPVLTDAGYHLIKVTEISGAEKPSYADREPVLKQQLQYEAAEIVFVKTVESLRNSVFNAEDLKGPADELGLNVVHSDWLSKNTASGVLANPQIITAAYSADVLTDGNNSEVLEIASDHYIVLRVLEHSPPHDKLLADVASEIQELLTKKKAIEFTLDKARASISAIKQGQSIASVAKENGYQLHSHLNVTRASREPSPDVLNSVFGLGAGNEPVIETFSLSNGDVVVVQLEDVVEGAFDDFSEVEKQGISAELERGNGNRGVRQFIESLSTNATIELL